MNELQQNDLTRFLLRYRWAGRLKAFKLRHRGGGLSADVLLRVRRAVTDLGSKPEPVTLHLRFAGVEECRVQKRVSRSIARFDRAMLAFLDGMFFASFDDWLLESGERPALHDFRGSDLYLAAGRLFWQERPVRSA